MQDKYAVMNGCELVDLRLRKTFLITNSIIFVVALMAVLLTPPLCDYHSYVTHWDLVLQKDNPWKQIRHPNAYGPFYNLFAFPYYLFVNFPKLLFVGSWFFTSLFLLTKILCQSKFPNTLKYACWAMLLVHPLFLVFGVVCGVNDTLVAALTVIGIYLYQQNQDMRAGLLIGSAILIKFMPLFLMPFLFYSQKKFRWRFTLTVLLLIVLTYWISWLVWGDNILAPFLFGSERDSKILSIFMYLRGQASPFLWFSDTTPNLDAWSIPVLLLSLLIVFILHIRYQFSAIFSCVLALVCALTFYKVGNIQYYFTPVMLIVLWLYFEYQSLKRRSFHFAPVWIYLGWITFCCLLCLFTDNFHHRWEYIREWIGLPAFIVGMIFIIGLLKSGIQASTRQEPFVLNKESLIQ